MAGKRRRSPHVQSLLTDLTVAVYGQMLDRLRKRPTDAHDAKVRDLSAKLLRQGVTPIELAIELAEMRESADKLYGYFSKNPSRRKARR